MSDRGIKKWAPYKTLSEQDFELKRQKNKENFIEKPLISRESAEEINEILVNDNNEPLRIGYYKNGKITCNSPNIRESELHNIFNDITKYLKIDLTNINSILSKQYQNSINSNILNQYILSKYIKEKLIELLLDRIIVSKINNNSNNIKLQIYLNISSNYLKKELNIINNNLILKKEYEFKRGYNTKGTKKYTCKYNIYCYNINN